MVKRLVDAVAAISMPATLYARDGQELLHIDCRDTVTPALLNASRGLSNGNHMVLGRHLMEVDESQRNSRYVWCDNALFMHGLTQPSSHQIAALRYAFQQGSWFANPKNKLFNRPTVVICVERGWLAQDGNEIRITSEGKRMLRNADLDEEHARQNPPKYRRNRKRNRGSESV